MADSNSMADAADDMSAISKTEPGQEGTPSSIESTPDPGAEADSAGPQDQAQPQKRKGGRKPIYATSEERKQRNRQAQAAFRERRTEYIKQLEAQIKQNEDALHSLQQSHRSAADECLMLRYKNSLLERILLEKGIDVQAELQVKTGSPAIPNVPSPSHHISAIVAQPPLQRAAMNRQYAQRRPMRTGPAHAQVSHENSFTTRSPQGQPTPSSHASSPTAMSMKSTSSLPQGAMTPPIAPGQAQQYRPQPRANYATQMHRQPPSVQYPPSSSGMSAVSAGSTHPGGASGSSTSAAAASAYYPSPFQKHIDQLEQEYDAPSQHTPIEIDAETGEPRPFLHDGQPEQYSQLNNYDGQVTPNELHQPQLHHHAAGKMQPPETSQHIEAGGQYPPMNQSFDPFDPMLDADPFGLSASMHFSTNYSYDQTQQR